VHRALARSRAGLTPFVRYLDSINLFSTFEKLFRSIKKNKKCQPLASIFKQIICFLADGTSSLLFITSISEGFCRSCSSGVSTLSTNKHIGNIACSERQYKKPPVIILGVDTMLMDNNDAEQRHGVQPTHKKVKGFRPLQLNLKGYFVDAVFRGGSKHSNYEDIVQKMIIHVVEQIRKHYSEDVSIILSVTLDFSIRSCSDVSRSLVLAFFCGGKHYADINEHAGSVKLEHWEQYKKGEGEKARVWSYYEFADRRGTWEIDEFLRAFYCTQEIEENGQYLMEFVKHDSIIYTNIGMGGKIDDQLINAGHGDMLKAGMIIETYFCRGSDELVNRAFKNFVSQKLPFRQFNMNAT